MLPSFLRVVALFFTFGFPQIQAQTYYGPQDPRIKTELALNVPCNGVSTTPDGRLFAVFARVDGSTGPQVVEVYRENNTFQAYPNAEWNTFEEGDDPKRHYIGVNGQRIGPDGNLWVIDKGAPALGAPIIFPGGPKLVVVDLTTDKVKRVYDMSNATRSNSLLDDVRFSAGMGKAYLTDAGSPGLIVLDLDSGQIVRLLDDDPSTKIGLPVSAEGTLLKLGDEPAYIYADQLEVSPNGKWFYFQSASGGMNRIETQWLDNAFYNASLNSNAVLGGFVQPYAHTPSTGGTAIDAEGNIYNSDTDSQRIIKIFPNGTMTTLVQDPRLLWVDAMWIDGDNKLWMPAAQLNRGTPFNNGESRIVKPLYVYSIDIGVGPSPIDHD
ncbi:hypothetical protein LTR37_006117 [Vermiconidia calcicola]|uniref:Uncharacterized protein n=1 Tax=Vermiconidia calcicola TaxID=1690605 RepID=A0ACC3NI06_9PEZI|nr:hypothetical protein LTR37_006117 [Vermiconidia calcicola]